MGNFPIELRVGGNCGHQLIVAEDGKLAEVDAAIQRDARIVSIRVRGELEISFSAPGGELFELDVLGVSTQHEVNLLVRSEAEDRNSAGLPLEISVQTGDADGSAHLGIGDESPGEHSDIGNNSRKERDVEVL